MYAINCIVKLVHFSVLMCAHLLLYFYAVNRLLFKKLWANPVIHCMHSQIHWVCQLKIDIITVEQTYIIFAQFQWVYARSGIDLLQMSAQQTSPSCSYDVLLRKMWCSCVFIYWCLNHHTHHHKIHGLIYSNHACARLLPLLLIC